MPDDFDFCEYLRVWRYDSSPAYTKRFSMDIFARAENPDAYSIIGEVKSRELKKFSKQEVMEFQKKFVGVKKIENIDRAVGFIFSRCVFTQDAQDYCREKGIACSEDERWLETVKSKPPVV
ncbi:MAG: hypothetical protein PVH61_23185 [Candidatus Aminicenantes bacterium]